MQPITLNTNKSHKDEDMKNLSLARIKAVFPHFNERPITEDDFWRAAKREKIIVREIPLAVDGYYQPKRGRHYILINSELTGVKWLHTALHEFCHYLFDVPGVPENHVMYRRPCGDASDPREMFADAFALVGLLPFPDLVRLQGEDLSDNAWLTQIVRDRIVVRADFRM